MDFLRRGPAEAHPRDAGHYVTVHPFADEPVPVENGAAWEADAIVRACQEAGMSVTAMPAGCQVDGYWRVRGEVAFVMLEHDGTDEREKGLWAWWGGRRGRPRLHLRAIVDAPITRQLFEQTLTRFLSTGVFGKKRLRCNLGSRPVRLPWRLRARENH